MRKKKVLIVEDSATVRTLLEHIIGNDPRLEIVASVTQRDDVSFAVLRRDGGDDAWREVFRGPRLPLRALDF